MQTLEDTLRPSIDPNLAKFQGSLQEKLLQKLEWVTAATSRKREQTTRGVMTFTEQVPCKGRSPIYPREPLQGFACGSIGPRARTFKCDFKVSSATQ